MKMIAKLCLVIFFFSQSQIEARSSFCAVEELQLSYVSLMNTEDFSDRSMVLAGLVNEWESYKCDYFKIPKLPEFFVVGHIDFLLDELIICAPKAERQDILEACLESIKGLGLLHYLYSNQQNGLSQLAVASQLFHDVKYIALDEMLDKYHWMEFKKIAEDLNEEWTRYTMLPFEDLSVCIEFGEEDIHENLVSQASNCMEEILACFDSAYRTDFELPCLEMEYTLNRLFEYYSEVSKSERALIKL